MEIFRSIEGFEEKYLISSYGRVISLVDNKGRSRRKELSPNTAKNGYLYVNLYKHSKSKTKKIHRLVAEAFIENSLHKPTVNHINGDKTDNRVDNLEWATFSENSSHAVRTGLKIMPVGEANYMFGRHGSDNPHSMKVLQFDADGNFVKEWDSVKTASKELGIHHIDGVARGERKTSGGFVWRYKDDIENPNG